MYAILPITSALRVNLLKCWREHWVMASGVHEEMIRLVWEKVDVPSPWAPQGSRLSPLGNLWNFSLSRAKACILCLCTANFLIIYHLVVAVWRNSSEIRIPSLPIITSLRFCLWLLQSSTEYWISCLTTVRWSLVLIVADTAVPPNCSFPFTYDGGLYYSCIENLSLIHIWRCRRRG